MSYENQFRRQYFQLSNPNSQYYQKAYSNLQNSLNASSPTVNSLLGIQMAMGGSYKGSIASANAQRKAIERRNAESAQQGINSLYVNSQGQALNALQGAQNAYEYEDSQPGFLDYLAAPASMLAGNYLGGLLGQTNKRTSGMSGGYRPAQGAQSWMINNNAQSNVGSGLPVGYKNVPSYDPFNY